MNQPDYPYAATLTVEAVKEYVAYIQSLAGDPEKAHGAEDDLRKEVLTAIAVSRLTGVDVLRAAMWALHTERIDFPRWAA